MALSNSQYDAIMREYGRQQIENQHALEERRREVYEKVPVIRELEAEIAGRSVACAKQLLEGDTGALLRLREELADLKEQKALLMKAAGFPEDCLELHYKCPDCRDTGLIRRAQMPLLSPGPDEASLCSIQSGPRCWERENFKTLSFDYYDDREALPQIGITNAEYMRRVVKSCRDFTENFDKKHENLLFTGSTGVGKTFLTNCIAKALMDSYHSVIYLSASDLFEVFSKTKFDYDHAEDMKDMYRYVLDCDLLIIE